MILPNGTVIPHGLLKPQLDSHLAAFNQSFKNFGMKAGYIIKAYAVNDPDNKYGLCTEYDVQVIEQDENKGTTAILYRHCPCFQGFGSVADFFEFNLRPQTYQTKDIPAFDGQDGSIVLLKCVDGIGSKGVVVGSAMHPDRTTNLTSIEPQLFWKYNGIAANINTDGSFSLSFNGATDNQGTPTNPSQGVTTLQIQTDGSFQFSHSTITIQANRSGVLNITTSSDANITVGGNTSITTSGTANIIAQGVTTVDGSSVLLGQSAVEAVIKGNTFEKIWSQHTHIGNLGLPSSPPLQSITPALSKHVYTT